MLSGTRIEIEANVLWQAGPSPASNRWIVVCQELDLAMEGDSLDELYNLIPEMIQLLFRDLLEDNELDQYLKDRGWKSQSVVSAASGDVEVDLPWKMVAERRNDLAYASH